MESQAPKRHFAGGGTGEDGLSDGSVSLQSLISPVSPPRKKRKDKDAAKERGGGEPGPEAKIKSKETQNQRPKEEAAVHVRRRFVKSPFELTAIRDLPAAANQDTVTIGDIFGDPLLEECWEFNYLHDLDFLVGALDADIRSHVRVHVVHGFWKREDPRRQRLEADAARFANVHLHTAFLPEPFGTHHSKMAVLLRRDNTAQVVIHTANLIPHDWANMTQGVWRSPLLPLLAPPPNESGPPTSSPSVGGLPGSGSRFKMDLLNYLRAYDTHSRAPVCRSLVDQLQGYDFSAVRGALIASVPGRHTGPSEGGSKATFFTGQSPAPTTTTTTTTTQWGWQALERVLGSVPLKQGQELEQAAESRPAHDISGPKNVQQASELVIQVSSIATLGANDTWLRRTLYDALCGGKRTTAAQGQQPQPQKQQQQQQKPKPPQLRIVFPTADEIRRSLDGYLSGTSIHMKIQSAQQQKQLAYMRPLMCHWANDAANGGKLPENVAHRAAGRRRAAPHIKTYIRYGPGGIDWALMTSANLSKQAWGEAVNATGAVRIASYEIGVLVWPELFGGEGATMEPVFGSNSLERPYTGEGGAGSANGAADTSPPVVALRVPYDIPLQPYGSSELPWVATTSHSEVDWRGETWQL